MRAWVRASSCPHSPVVCSRLFRFSSFYVNRKSKIRTAKDLKGKKVGNFARVTGAYFFSAVIAKEKTGYREKLPEHSSRNRRSHCAIGTRRGGPGRVVERKIFFRFLIMTNSETRPILIATRGSAGAGGTSGGSGTNGASGSSGSSGSTGSGGAGGRPLEGEAPRHPTQFIPLTPLDEVPA